MSQSSPLFTNKTQLKGFLNTLNAISGQLPEGFNVENSIEHGGWGVSLTDPNGNSHDVQEDSIEQI